MPDIWSPTPNIHIWSKWLYTWARETIVFILWLQVTSRFRSHMAVNTMWKGAMMGKGKLLSCCLISFLETSGWQWWETGCWMRWTFSLMQLLNLFSLFIYRFYLQPEFQLLNLCVIMVGKTCGISGMQTMVLSWPTCTKHPAQIQLGGEFRRGCFSNLKVWAEFVGPLSKIIPIIAVRLLSKMFTLNLN